MKKPETKLLLDALLYEEGHPRRTQHILKVYALAKLLGECSGLGEEERQILQAAAILHDIPIKYCKERYKGDACQANQQKEAPGLVRDFLQQAGYPPDYLPRVLELVVNHHCYTGKRILLSMLTRNLFPRRNVYMSEASFIAMPGKSCSFYRIKGKREEKEG